MYRITRISTGKVVAYIDDVDEAKRIVAESNGASEMIYVVYK